MTQNYIFWSNDTKGKFIESNNCLQLSARVTYCTLTGVVVVQTAVVVEVKVPRSSKRGDDLTDGL